MARELGRRAAKTISLEALLSHVIGGSDSWICFDVLLYILVQKNIADISLSLLVYRDKKLALAEVEANVERAQC